MEGTKDMDDVKKLREKAEQASSLKEYIAAYKELWENTIDFSPYGVERTTEERMIRELEAIVKKTEAILG